MTVSVFAPAKINLTLHVTGQRDDGHHLLDSLVVFAPVGDQLQIEGHDINSLTVVGPEGANVPADANNLALRAAEMVAPDRPVSIRLEKYLPVSSGIGGGSSDAAAVVRGMMADWDDRTSLMALGADVPMCLRPHPQRVRGIGEISEPVHLPPLPAVLVNPRVSVSTPAVFRALDAKKNTAMPEQIPKFGGVVDLCVWLSDQRNDLEEPAIQLCPEIGQVLKVLGGLDGALLARMSGSGATCFAIFETEELATAARQEIAKIYPNWWLASGVLGDMVERSKPIPS